MPDREQKLVDDKEQKCDNTHYFTIRLSSYDAFSLLNILERQTRFINVSDNSVHLFEEISSQVHGTNMVVFGSKKHKRIEPDHPTFQKSESKPKSEPEPEPKPRKGFFKRLFTP